MKSPTIRSLVIFCVLLVSCWFSLRTSLNRLPRSAPNAETTSPTRLLSAHVKTDQLLGADVTDDHNTEVAADDHGGSGETGHAAGHPTLFRAMSAIHVARGTFAMFIIIAFILALKQVVEALYAFTQDTPFYEMVGKIEEELMLVGTSSFLFKVVLNTTDFSENDWAYPLEFAEMLVPILAFSYCALGVYVILISLKQCYTWSRAHNLKVLEILDDYFEATKSVYFGVVWKPLLDSIEQMEFRIFHNIFCSTFQIQKGAFAFDEYVAKVFQRSVLELIEIRLLDWMYVTVLLLVNLGRVKLGLHYHSCEVHDIPCDDRRDVYLFTIIGAFVFAFALLMLVASRRLELSILSLHGLTSHLHYAKYIQYEEEAEKRQDHRMDAAQLKDAASKAKEINKQSGKKTAATRLSIVGGLSSIGGASGKLSGPSAKYSKVALCKPTGSAKETDPGPALETEGSVEGGFSQDSVKAKPAVAPSTLSDKQMSKVVPFNDQDGKEDDSAPLKNVTSMVSLVSENPEDRSFGGEVTPVQGVEEDAEEEKRNDREEERALALAGAAAIAKDREARELPCEREGRQGMQRQQSVRVVAGSEELTLAKQSEVVMNVFWLGQPDLYFESVQFLFLVVAFYISLWLVVMVSAAPSNGWKALSIVPAVLVCIFFFYIVKTAALLKAIYVVDTDALLEVIEETDAANQLGAELRTRVVEQVNASGVDTYIELERLYKQIDVNNSNSLSRSEFGDYLSLLGISFSRKKWERIFKEIDRNYDNEISFQEFFLFLFPDHDLAQSLEMRRLKVISRRVMSRANYFLSHLSPFRDAAASDRRASVFPGQDGGAPSPLRSMRRGGLSFLPTSVRSVSNRDFSTPEQRAAIMARLAAAESLKRQQEDGAGEASVDSAA